ncbi:MAG: tetratricopeptide repeat protein [Verrucomicrobiales bacterium]
MSAAFSGAPFAQIIRTLFRGFDLGWPALVALAGFVLIAVPLLRWVRSLYGADHPEKPPLDYRLARSYAGQRRFAEAAELYERIIAFYPGEAPAYLELFAIYAEDPAPAEQIEQLVGRAGAHLPADAEMRAAVEAAARAALANAA